MTSLRLDKWLQAQARRLADAGVESPQLEAEIFYAEAAGVRRGSWFPDEKPRPQAARQTEEWIARRVRREPLQYILGHAPFRDLELFVSPAVLIPRPETELLVDHVLQHLPRGGSLLDVGTGSGAIALATAYERPDVRVTAVDYSREALQTARRNAAKYNLDVSFLESDLLDSVTKVFDVIAANLPYVTEKEYETLEPELFFEPKLALTAPDEGLELIFRLAKTAPEHLAPGGFLIFEIGEHQAERLCRYLHTLPYRDIAARRDYCGVQRFVSAVL